MVKFLREVGPSVVLAQECTKEQVITMSDGLGVNWSFWGEPSNRQVLWDGDKWDAIDAKPQALSNGQEATHVLLQSRSTGGRIWVSSVHLTQGSTNSAARHQEIREILRYVKVLPGTA